MNTDYKFDPEEVYEAIKLDWMAFSRVTNIKNIIIGISGGIDSTCVASLACRIFGPEHVIGVSMPCNGQKDIDDVNKVFNFLKISRLNIDIGTSFNEIVKSLNENFIDVSYDTCVNLPARLRMSTLYAVAQSLNGMVINTCNLSEDVVGYATLFGDSAGSYAPINKLTKTEVKNLSDWLGVPTELVNKTPIDGLQALSDEDKLGFTYSSLDSFIRENKGTDEFKKIIIEKYKKNKFKTDIIRIPGPDFMFNNYVENN